MNALMMVTVALLAVTPVKKKTPKPKAAPAGKVPAAAKPSDAPLAVPLAVPSTPLARARAFIQNFDFEKAIVELELALQQPGLTTANRIELLALEANAYSALDDKDKAAAAFASILELNPSYELGSSSPKVRENFAKGKQLVLLRQPVSMAYAEPTLNERGEATLDVKLGSGAARVTEVTLHYRLDGAGSAYAQLPFVRTGETTFAVKLPQLFDGPPRDATLVYFIRARDLVGAVVGTIGADDAPLKAPIRTVQLGTPLYKSWVLWTVVGVVAAGAVATPFIVRATTTAPVQPGSLGLVQLK